MEEKLNILLCEDDENLGMLLREYLQAKGYNAELCPDGDAGYKAFIKNKYDICVFDVMMPKKDGFTLAKEIRAINSDVPIMFLTAKNLKDDIFEGFKIGADDYITKPFSMEELTLRMEAILRRVHGKKNREVTAYQIGKFTFDAKKQILAIGDKSTKLTTKESELLNLLCALCNLLNEFHVTARQALGTLSREYFLHALYVLDELTLIVGCHRDDVVHGQVTQHTSLNLYGLHVHLPFHLVTSLQLLLVHHLRAFKHLDA